MEFAHHFSIRITMNGNPTQAERFGPRPKRGGGGATPAYRHPTNGGKKQSRAAGKVLQHLAAGIVAWWCVALACPQGPIHAAPGAGPAAAAQPGGLADAQSPTGARPTDRAGGQAPLDIVIVLDNSGSMKSNDPDFLTRTVVMNFVESLGESSRLGMVVFAGEASLVNPLSHVADASSRSGFVNSLKQVDYRGKLTNSPAGIEKAIYELKANGRPGARKLIVFLTDGIVDTGDKTSDRVKERWLKEDLALQARQLGIRVYAIAFTDKADFSLIQSLAANTGGDYFRALHAEAIGGVFDAIAQRLAGPAPMAEAAAESARGPKQMAGAPAAPAGGSGGPVFQQPAQHADRGLPYSVVFVAAAGGVALVAIGLRRRRRHLSRPPTAPPAKGAEGLAPPLTDPGMTRAELIDIDLVTTSRILPLRKPVTAIGRDPANDIVIGNKMVSASHATITFTDGCYRLEDLSSTNGTFLNRKKLEPYHPVRLKSGDEIAFDLCLFRFVLPDQGLTEKTVVAPRWGADEAQRLAGPADNVPDPLAPDPGANMATAARHSGEPAAADLLPGRQTRLSAPGSNAASCPDPRAGKATTLCSDHEKKTRNDV
jgi:pSer/pThr/pTyr-binding forkhead associated (FHA) protein/Mg-chelatase subunit ChlD